MKHRMIQFRAAVIAALCFPVMGMLLPDPCLLQKEGTLTVCAAEAEPLTEQAGTPSYTVTEVSCHVRATVSLLVWAWPFEHDATQCVAQVKAGTVFMVCGVADNGWFQVYYLGQKYFISPAYVEFYTGVEENTPLPSLKTDIGTRVAFLGDSITFGDTLSTQNDTYASCLARMIGADACANYGWNGSTMGGTRPDRFIDRYLSMSNDMDLVFVFGGTNDYGFSTPLGTMGDSSSATFYGTLNLLMSGLKQKYPEGQVVFLTPIHRLRGDRKNKAGYILEDYVNAIVSMGAFYDIPVVDLYHAPTMNFVGRQGYLADGLHPTVRGHKVLAGYLYELMWTQRWIDDTEPRATSCQWKNRSRLFSNIPRALLDD